LARDGSVAHRLARRANALVLLDDGMSCAAVAKVLFLDNDTIRTWYQLYQQDGIEGLAGFGHEGGICRLKAEQQDRLKTWIGETLPRTTRQIGAWIERECGIDYQSRSGLIALLHRLGMEHRKPKAISRKLDPAKQEAFIKAYEALLNRLSADEALIFADAVHPTHAVRPVGCWAPKEVAVAVEQSSGRDRLNIHGAIDLETSQTIMKDVLSVDALSTILLLTTIETMYPGMRFIHVFLDNARYHHAKLVQAWLVRPDCRIRFHFVPTYCPHLNPIERLWGLMPDTPLTTDVMPPSGNSAWRCCVSCGKRCLRTGGSGAIRSRIVFASSTQSNSGLSGDPGIIKGILRPKTRWVHRKECANRVVLHKGSPIAERLGRYGPP
jgi:transposase